MLRLALGDVPQSASKHVLRVLATWHVVAQEAAKLKATCSTCPMQAKDKVDQCYDDAPIFSNLPPAAGAIYWARCSRHRINEPMNKLAFYNLALRETPEEFREVKKQHQTLDKMLQDYELQRYQTWEQTSVEAAKEKLKMRLLRRQEKSGLLKVNFDPALVRLLREVRFFLIFDIEVPPVPWNARGGEHAKQAAV